ncbi:MAG: type II toxin-antitoxin system VapC family toxin [Terracidiphilus sp.]|jgi:predicted nucleic-acid-binding protein
MTGLDTNILVRFFVKDDLEQSRRAKELLRTLTPESPGFVSLVALAEMIWVLRSQYRMPKSELVLCLERLLDSTELTIENHTAVHQALQRFAGSKADFADCIIELSCHAGGCGETVTFDLNASRFAGMRLL